MTKTQRSLKRISTTRLVRHYEACDRNILFDDYCRKPKQTKSAKWKRLICIEMLQLSNTEQEAERLNLQQKLNSSNQVGYITKKT